MPKSRGRHRTKKHHRKRLNPLALDRMFDGIVEESFKVGTPEVLYHYTSWSGAEGILRSRQFWATAHDCTNDEAELRSADEIIQRVAVDLRRRLYGAAAVTLDKFLEGYPTLQISHLRTVYMTCFSLARDDKEQWRKYADDGRGLCLGVRILNEQPPEEADRATKIARVDYSEASWRETLTTEFLKILRVMERAQITQRNIELGLLALHRIAAFAAITAKRAPWEVEQEYRRVTIVHNEAAVEPKVRVSGSRSIRYLISDARANGKKVALAEIVLGPNQNADEAQKRLLKFLGDCGYEIGDLEYPKMIASAVAPWSFVAANT
ncbi:MAG TPA: DUF2971 domain-containing protein [Candidatus Acidoferrum sp.]|nr:DUF2971 domain-containing protein [Candidatus Acidoferrum sp.]